MNECSSAYIFQKLVLCVIKIMRKILAMSSVSLNHLYSVIWFHYTDKRKLWLDFVCMYYRRKLIRQRKNRIVNIDTLQRVSIHSLVVAFKPVYYRLMHLFICIKIIVNYLFVNFINSYSELKGWCEIQPTVNWSKNEFQNFCFIFHVINLWCMFP